jgi:hypothetical protein
MQYGDNMEMKEINSKEVCDILNEIMEYELAGVGSLYTLLFDGYRAL